jgi:hypothetical protein
MIDIELQNSIDKASMLISELGYSLTREIFDIEGDYAKYIVSFETPSYLICFIVFNYDDLTFDFYDKKKGESLVVPLEAGTLLDKPKKFVEAVLPFILRDR